MNWTIPYPCRSRRDSVRRINMSSEPGNESFFCALRPIPRILSLQHYRTPWRVIAAFQVTPCLGGRPLIFGDSRTVVIGHIDNAAARAILKNGEGDLQRGKTCLRIEPIP